MATITRKKDRCNKTITYYGDDLSCRKIQYCVYSEKSDITFIMEDKMNSTQERDCISTEVIGFYYGKPNIEDMELYMGNLKAVFEED